MRTNEIKNEIGEIKKWKKKIKRKDLKYEANKYIHDLQQFETIISSGNSVYTGKINIYEAEMDQSNPIKNMVEFTNKCRPKKKQGKIKKKNSLGSIRALYEGQKFLLPSKVKSFQ